MASSEQATEAGPMARSTTQAGPDFARRTIEDERADFPCGYGAGHEVGLALSGGGLRATLFHLGALGRLRELGWLPRLDRISGVSGGSIVAAVLARNWQRLEDADFSKEAFDALISGPTLRFAGRRIDAFVIAAGLVPGVNPAHLMARVFRSFLTGDTRLDQLPDRPRFVFNAASLATGVAWRFQKPYMGDSRLGIVCDPDVPLADAVAASASFPPLVAPFVLDLRGRELRKVDGADLFDQVAARALHDRVLLLDGGAYDNLGIEPVDGTCRIVLASSAGGNLKVDPRRDRYRFWWPLLRRTLDMAVEVGRAQRRHALIDRAIAAREIPDDSEYKERYRTEHVALWRTSNDVTDHALLPPGWSVAEGWSDYLASRPTRLWPMPPIDRHRLVNWGYLTSDLMLRSYVPELSGAEPPTALPFPSVDFAAPPPR